jgi:HD superfamily phosphohydrolase
LFQRNYRDPLHNIISLDEALPDDRLIVELIDTAEFQRLRRVKQLGLAMFTYQGAEHSRFTHSIGVMHLMTRALNLLSARHSISEEQRAVARAGALLHDVGHGPFSHVMEHASGFHHEDWTRRVILDPNTEVNSVLANHDPSLPHKIASLYDHSYRPAFIWQLVSSQLDCDRMDYLLRDSLMTGAKYGIYDLEWVLHALKIDEANDRIYVEAKGLYAVEEYLQARYYMFRQVYFHRTLRSAEAVLLSTLKRARELAAGGTLGFSAAGLPFGKLLMGAPLTTIEYLELDDTDVTYFLKQWSRDRDRVLSDLASRFVNRRLLKASDIGISGERSEEFKSRAIECVASAGFEPDYYLIFDRASDVPFYGYYSTAGKDPSALIYIEAGGAGGAIKEISQVSDVVRGLRGYKIDRICYPAEVGDQMSRLIAEFARDERTTLAINAT